MSIKVFFLHGLSLQVRIWISDRLAKCVWENCGFCPIWKGNKKLGHIYSSSVNTSLGFGIWWLQNLALNMWRYLHGTWRDPLRSGGIEEPAWIFHHARPWPLSPCLSRGPFEKKETLGCFVIRVRHRPSYSPPSSTRPSFGWPRVQRN